MYSTLKLYLTWHCIKIYEMYMEDKMSPKLAPPGWDKVLSVVGQANIKVARLSAFCHSTAVHYTWKTHI